MSEGGLLSVFVKYVCVCLRVHVCVYVCICHCQDGIRDWEKKLGWDIKTSSIKKK